MFRPRPTLKRFHVFRTLFFPSNSRVSFQLLSVRSQRPQVQHPARRHFNRPVRGHPPLALHRLPGGHTHQTIPGDEPQPPQPAATPMSRRLQNPRVSLKVCICCWFLIVFFGSIFFLLYKFFFYCTYIL